MLNQKQSEKVSLQHYKGEIKGNDKKGGKIQKKWEETNKKGENPKIKKNQQFHEFKSHDSFSKF